MIGKQYKKVQISNLDSNETNVAGSIDVFPNEGFREVIKPNVIQDKKVKYAIIKWILGGIAMHTTCKHCGECLSRKHAIQCTDTETILKEKYHSVLNNYKPERNIIDRLLNQFRNKAPTGEFYEDIYKCIKKIYTQCLGYHQLENGHWQDRNRIEEESNTTVFRGTNARTWERIYSFDRLERNRRLGRPRRNNNINTTEGIG